MAVQYSIISILIRPEIQEKISVGLLLFDFEQVYFSFSKIKLQVSKELLSNSSYKILKEILEGIERKVESDSSNYSDYRGFKIFKNKVFDNSFSSSYISYLNRYSNNIVSFSNPKSIAIELNSTNFKSLFSRFISEIIEEPEIVIKEKPIEYIKNKFGDRMKNFYDFNREVTHNQVKNLIAPVRIDFVGRNGIDVYAQTVDMEAKIATVSNHINAFVQLKTTYIKNNIGIKDFLIAKEPLKATHPKQHDIWTQLKQSTILNYLDLSDSEAILEYAEKNRVLPLSKLETPIT